MCDLHTTWTIRNLILLEGNNFETKLISNDIYLDRSSVTAPTITAVSPSRPGFFIKRTILAKEIGGLLILLINKRLKMISLNFEPVRRARNRYNWKNTNINVSFILFMLQFDTQTQFDMCNQLVFYNET